VYEFSSTFFRFRHEKYAAPSTNAATTRTATPPTSTISFTQYGKICKHPKYRMIDWDCSSLVDTVVFFCLLALLRDAIEQRSNGSWSAIRQFWRVTSLKECFQNKVFYLFQSSVLYQLDIFFKKPVFTNTRGESVYIYWVDRIYEIHERNELDFSYIT